MEALSWFEAFLFCYCSLWQLRVACIRQDNLSYRHQAVGCSTPSNQAKIISVLDKLWRSKLTSGTPRCRLILGSRSWKIPPGRCWRHC